MKKIVASTCLISAMIPFCIDFICNKIVLKQNMLSPVWMKTRSVNNDCYECFLWRNSWMHLLLVFSLIYIITLFSLFSWNSILSLVALFKYISTTYSIRYALYIDLLQDINSNTDGWSQNTKPLFRYKSKKNLYNRRHILWYVERNEFIESKFR